MPINPHLNECHSCAAWEPHDNNQQGYCRRHAPTVPAYRPDTNQDTEVTWPTTYKDDWCWDHLGKVPPLN